MPVLNADMTGRLTGLLQREFMSTDCGNFFAEVEMPLVPVLAHMERNGVKLDTDLLREHVAAAGRAAQEPGKGRYTMPSGTSSISTRRSSWAWSSLMS